MMVTWTRVVEGKVIRIGVGFRHILKADSTGLADGRKMHMEKNKEAVVFSVKVCSVSINSINF